MCLGDTLLQLFCLFCYYYYYYYYYYYTIYMRTCKDVELAVRLVRLPIELDVTPSGLAYGYNPKRQAAGSSDMLVIV